MNNLYLNFSLLLLLCSSLYSQQENNFKEIDSISRSVKYDGMMFLSDDITEHCDTELEKVRAIFVWVAENISYDFELFNSESLKNEFYVSEKTLIENTIERRKAICSGYSVLVKRLCSEAEIECEIINGIGRDSELPAKVANHAWNLVKINDKWCFLDVTWASGYGNYSNNKFTKKFNDFWFLTKPEDFITTHFPLDNQKWTLLEKEYTIDEFNKLPIILNKEDYIKREIIFIKPKDGIVKVENKIVRLEFEVKDGLSDFIFWDTPYRTIEIIKEEVKGNNIVFSFSVKSENLKKIGVFYKGKFIENIDVVYK